MTVLTGFAERNWLEHLSKRVRRHRPPKEIPLNRVAPLIQ